jgi:hypothetical protein
LRGFGGPVPEKLFEIIVKNQLNQYIENENILIKQQSGLRRNHSYETSLNVVYSKSQTLERRD